MNDRVIEPSAPRIIPPLTDANRPFWTGGADGTLMIQWCDACGRYVHPPSKQCPACGGVLEFRPVSGNGTVFTYTVNHQPYHPDVPVPYVIALVALDEQDDVRLPTNIVNCDPEALECGMAVRVLFEVQGEAFVPVFEPA